MSKFNKVLLEFLDALATVFPEVSSLSTYRNMATTVIAFSPQLPAQTFLQNVGPSSIAILQRDPAFFQNVPGLIPGVDIAGLWKAPDLSEESRNIIWDYLTNLYLLAAESALPQLTGMAQQLHQSPEVMKLAAELSQKLLATEGSGADVAGLLRSAVQQLPTPSADQQKSQTQARPEQDEQTQSSG